MTGSAAAHRALEHIDAEADAVVERGEAFEGFAEHVREIPAENPASTAVQRATAATPVATAVQTQGSTPSVSRDRCVTVREAFVETVRPYSTADLEDEESLAETIAAELTEDIAVALATETGWTPALKRAVLEAVEDRQREVTALQETLQNERDTLEEAIDEIDEIVAWLQSTADESLLQCDFDTLREKHERLTAYRERLAARTEARQAQFTGSTNRYGPGGTRYRTVVVSLYSACSTRYPILSSTTRLYGICGDCQRTVRAHLTRRV